MNKKDLKNLVESLIFSADEPLAKNDINKIISLSKDLNCKILTTEKDFIRLKDLETFDIKFVSSKLKILNEEKFLKTLSKIYE